MRPHSEELHETRHYISEEVDKALDKYLAYRLREIAKKLDEYDDALTAKRWLICQARKLESNN